MANANDLRKFVEGVDSIRGQDFFLVVRNGRLEVAEVAARDPGTSIAVRTDLRGGGGLDGTAKLSVNPGDFPPGPPFVDAAFTTQAAFEKFVLPYYCRTRSMEELNDMANRFFKGSVTCAYHLPSSAIDESDGTLFLLHKNGDKELI